MSTWRINKGKRVLIDNGSYKLKVGVASSLAKKKVVNMFNYIGKSSSSYIQ